MAVFAVFLLGVCRIYFVVICLSIAAVMIRILLELIINIFAIRLLCKVFFVIDVFELLLAKVLHDSQDLALNIDDGLDIAQIIDQ